MLFTNTRLGSYAKDPAVVRFNGKYFLYYTVRYSEKMIGVGIATSNDLENWTDVTDIPLEYDHKK